MIPNHTKIQPFDLKTQKLVFDVFYAQFSEQIETDNCFLLTDVGQKISNVLKENGLPGAKINVFRACPQYFICGYDTEKHTDTFKAEAVAIVDHEVSQRFMSEQEFRKKEEANIANKLKKHFKFNEVPVRDVEDFLKKQNIVYTDIYELIQQELPGMKLKELSLGEGHPIENFLVIHPPKDVPENIKKQIIWIIKNLFADQPLAKNTDLGAAFHKFGIDYKQYDYLHLTAFIRSFTDYFSIIPLKNGDENNVDIVVQIFHHNVQQYDVSELDSLMFEKMAKATEQTNGKKPIDDPHFRNGILETYQKGSYEILTEKIYMSYGLQHLDDTAIWTVYINAFLKRGTFQKASEYTLNAWEKAVFPLNLADLETMWKDQNQMEDFGFSAEEIQALEPLFHREHGKVTNVNALAMRLATFLPKNSLLPEIMYHISLLQSEKAIRESGLRNLSVHYLTQNKDEELLRLWEHHLPNVTFRAAARVFSACMEQRKHALIRPLWEKLPQEIATHSLVHIYPFMADYLQKLPEAEAEETALLNVLSPYQEKDQLAHLTEVCQVLLWQEHYLAVGTLFGALLTTYPRRQVNRLLGQLYELLVPHEKAIVSSFNESYHPTQIKLCAFGEFLLSKNIEGSQWESKREEVISFYQEQIAMAQEEKAFSLVETALSVFPEDTYFTQTHIRLLEEKYISPTQEEPYKEIFVKLSEKKNYLAMISLSESDKLTRYREEIWYQELMLSAYRHEAALAKAIRLQAALLAGMHYKHRNYLPYAQALCTDLHDLFYGVTNNIYPEEISPSVLLEYLKDLIRNAETNSYQNALVVVKLLMQEEKYLFAAFVYALTVSSNTVAKDTEQMMRTNLPILLQHLPHLTETTLNDTDAMLQHILTNLPMKDIKQCLSIGKNFLTLDQFETRCDAYWAEQDMWGVEYSLSKMIVSAFKYMEVWKIYENKTIHIAPLNYTALLMRMYYSEKPSRELSSRYIAALNTFKKEQMPENLLELNYHLLTTKYNFAPCWKAFLSYVSRTNAFSDCDSALLERYLSFTYAHPQYQEITLEIYKQAKGLSNLLNEDNTLNEEAAQALGVDSLLCMILHYLKESTTLTKEQTENFSLFIDFAEKHANSIRQKTAIVWIEEMLKRRATEGIDSDYFRISFRLLQHYPKWDHIIFTEETDGLPYENYCNLIDRWLEINADYVNARSLYYYYSGLPPVADEHERRLRFRYLSNACTKMYKLEVATKSAPGSSLRTTKTLLTLYFLNSFYDIPHVLSSDSELAQMYEDKLPSLHEKADLKRFANGLLNLWKADFPHYFRDCLAICGITNYWDRFLMEMADSAEYRKLLTHEAISQYTAVLEYPKLNRRLLQMLIYAKIADYNYQKEETEQIPISHEDYDTFYDLAENQKLSQAFFDNLAELFPLSGNQLVNATTPFYTSSEESLKDLLQAAELLIRDKMPLPMLSALLEQTSKDYANTLAELVFFLQYPEQIADTLEHLIHENADHNPNTMLALLTNTVFAEKIGEFYSGYFLALYYHTQSEFEKAADALPNDDICPEPYSVKLANLKNAIAMRSILSDTSQFSNLLKLHKLSFMEARSPAPGEECSDLIRAFNSGTHTASAQMLIQLAQKIYYLILSGESYADYGRFIMRWGFLEIKIADNYNYRLSLMKELTNHAQFLDNIEEFKPAFLEAYQEILLSYSEQSILAEFDIISTVGQDICKLYDEHPLSKALDLLYPIAEDFRAPSDEFCPKLNQLVSESIPLKVKYTNMQLVQKCCDVISYYQTQVENKIQLEFEILNEDGFSSGSVFYTVKNIGSFPVKDLQVSLSFLKDGEHLFGVPNEFEYLPKGQMLAEEVEIEYFFQKFPPETEFQICVDISYICQEQEARTIQKECTLTSKEETYEYIYRTGDDLPIGRMELSNIHTAVSNRNFVMLYGTNGTGKTSLLKMLRDRLQAEDTTKQKTFVVLLAENSEKLTTTSILKKIMTSFCYCEDAAANTESVYEQLKTFLKYAVLREEIPQATMDIVLSEYREYVTCSLEDSQFVFSNFLVQLNNLNNKFLNFKKELGLDFKFCLLWDAFETVISSDRITPEEMNFKNLIDTFKGEKNQIRIVFTGSNKLLEVAEVKDDADSWNIMFRDISGPACIKIGNLHRADFDRILTDPALLNDGEIHFAQVTLDFLYDFTNGHVNYSKLFVAQALETLSNRRVKRRCIYPSDLKIHGSDRKNADNEQQVAKNLTKQIFQDINQDYAVINVGKTLADMISDSNQAAPAVEVKKTVLSSFHDISSQQFDRAIDILKARDFVTEEENTYEKPTYRFTSVLYLHHFLNRDFTAAEPVDDESTLDKLIQEINDNKKFSPQKLGELTKALGELAHKTNITNIENQYNDHAIDQSIGTQTNIQINAQTIATTFNSILTADQGELQKLFASLPMASGFIAESKKEELATLYEQLELQEQRPIDLYDLEGAKELQKEQEALHEQISAIVEPAITEMHNTYKNAVIMTNDTIDQFAPWEILGFQNKGEYEVMTHRLEPEFVADLYFAAKLDYLFRNMQEDEIIPQQNTDFSPVSIMYCKLIEKMLKFYHTDIYADKLKSASTQNSLKDPQTHKDRLILFGDLATDTTLTKEELQFVRNKIMIGAFLWPINPRFGNEESRELLSDHDFRLAKKWQLHGDALNDISRTRNDSAHGSSNQRITHKRLQKLKCWLFERKELQNIVELSLAHREGKEILETIQAEDQQMLNLLTERI